ncbi:hypothetical protein [Empedobacter sp.]|uniref:hypothetical protein n=1 Tax=Empedobacter sp. TaxID=1927715 RepID=UPI00289B8FB9|nr:hypothetical protein [Empedobacter sp.]
MKVEILRKRVEAKLLKYNNASEVEKMMNEKFEQASRLYNNTKSIFEFIVTH